MKVGSLWTSGLWKKLTSEKGGKGDAPAPVVVQPPPPTVTQLPQPNVGENSQQLFESQLKFNPQLTQQQVQLQGQYAPQLAQQQFDIQKQFAPQYRSLYQEAAPTQTANLEQLASQVGQRLSSPSSLTPEQQAAQDSVYNRENDRLMKAIRTQSNIGGTLYGGNRENREVEGLTQLANQRALSDIQLQQQQRQQLMQELALSSQPVFPMVQQPQVQTFGQGVTPSPDALMAAIQGSQYVQPAAIGFQQQQPNPWGQIGGQVAGTAAAKLFFMCLPGEALIDTTVGVKPIEDIEPGDVSGEFNVLMKYVYIAEPTEFVQLILSDGHSVETCSKHIISGREAQDYQEGDNLQGYTVLKKVVSIRRVKTYDLLTDAKDGGYYSGGIYIQSMIPAMHKFAQQLQGAA